VPIYEAGEIEGLLFLAMRYVEGEDLGALLRREGTLDSDRTAAMGRQLGDALDAAHARGLVHRDVKPSNVLVARESGDEHVYVADFGITKSVATAVTATDSGHVVGTVAYAAPEVIRGEAVDARADVYSLGCMLYQCLTGELPFPRDSEVATIYAHLEEAPPDVTERRPGLPAAIDPVVAKSLAKKPADRWQSAGALAAAVTTALGSGARARSHHVRRWRVIAAAAGVAALVAASSIALLTRGDDGSLSPASIDADAVAVVDPGARALTAQVGVGTSPSHIAAGAGAVWVANADDQSVSLIDPATHTVNQTIPLTGGAGAIAVGEDAVWVVNHDGGTVSRISPVTNPVVDTIPVGNGPTGVCAGGGAVWVAAADDRVLARVDPSAGRVTRRLPVDSRPSALACADGSIWATSESSGTLSEISPSSGGAVHPIAVGGGASGLAVAGDDVWVANTLDGTVSRVDRRRGVVAATIPVGSDDGPTAIAVGVGGVWVSNEYGGTVVRIAPDRDAVAQRLRIGNRPQGLAIIDGALWIGVRDSGARHRGGTLRVASGFPYNDGAYDPAITYAAFPWTVLSTAYDGLTAFRRTGGGDGRTLVPDLALSLPEPADHGRTYLFRLRDGVRYSTGAPLRAGDFRRGLERAMRAKGSPATQLFDRIVGAETCARKRSACDLSRGVVTDDATGTVVVHLTARDGDLLYKLALPTAAPVPPGTDRPRPRRFPPATGPYTIASVPGEEVLRLARNPHFRSWSEAARPAGYPDEISVAFGTEPRTALAAVARNDADFTQMSPGDARPAELRARYAGQVYSSDAAVTEYAFLNTRRPPFDDPDVRRAISFAFDRRAAVALEGGPDYARTTCQMLPPSFPGYQPYCPYTASPGRGRAWSAPDFAKARRLVARARTRGMHVTIWLPGEQFVPVGRVLARTLRDLGYRTSMRADLDEFFEAAQVRNSRVQIGIQKWGADYPAASTFLQTLFGCRTPQDLSVLYNWSQYCDPRTEQLIRRGLRLQGSDDPAADTWWARADQRVVDQAGAVPLLNTKQIDLVSRRVGNHQYNPQWGTLLDQLWVR